ncbi:MAG: hypothetical protein ACI4UU_01100 [Clostridia bacterium]
MGKGVATDTSKDPLFPIGTATTRTLAATTFQPSPHFFCRAVC